MAGLTLFDKRLLNLLQGRFPISPRPFQVLADELGSTEELIIAGIERLKKKGYIRRIGTFFNSDKLGYSGTLVALAVDDKDIETVANCINSYNGITHNYEREGSFNIWFTLLSSSKDEENKILDSITRLRGVQNILKLRSTKKYKINVRFDLK